MPPILLEAPYSVGFALWAARLESDAWLEQQVDVALAVAQQEATETLRAMMLRCARQPEAGLDIDSILHESLVPKSPRAEPADPNPRVHVHLISADQMTLPRQRGRKRERSYLPQMDTRGLAAEVMATWTRTLRGQLGESGLDVPLTAGPSGWDIGGLEQAVSGLPRLWCGPPGRSDDSQVAPLDYRADPFADRR